MLLGMPFSQPFGESQGRSDMFAESVVEQPPRARADTASIKRKISRR